MTILAGALAAVLAFHGGVEGQDGRRAMGLTLRGSFWDLPRGPERLSWTSGQDYELFESNGVGGWVSFLGAVSDRVLVELSLGGVVRTVEEVRFFGGIDTYVEVLVPFLVGARFYPIRTSGTGMSPYLSLGLGPYWDATVISLDSDPTDNTSVGWDHRFGGYAGVGVDAMFIDWMGLNFDLRWHEVDFPGKPEYSGLEASAGVQFMWGRRR
jgi:outer membrane protein W